MKKTNIKQISLLDYTFSEQNPIYFTLTDKNDSDIPHKHNFVEIAYVVSGEIQHTFSNSNAQKISEGDILLILPSQWHTYSRKNQSYCAHRDILISTEFFNQSCDFLSPNLLNYFQSGKIPVKTHVSLTKIHSFENQISAILQMPYVLNEHRQMMVRSFAIRIISCFISSNSEEEYKHIPAWFRELLANFDRIEYMQAGLNKITEKFVYDKKYMCHVFKKYMGITMTEHLNDSRLAHAIILLQNTDRSILDISSELGFSSVAYFSTVFKNKYGMSPSQIRKKSIQ